MSAALINVIWQIEQENCPFSYLTSSLIWFDQTFLGGQRNIAFITCATKTKKKTGKWIKNISRSAVNVMKICLLWMWYQQNNDYFESRCQVESIDRSMLGVDHFWIGWLQFQVRSIWVARDPIVLTAFLRVPSFCREIVSKHCFELVPTGLLGPSWLSFSMFESNRNHLALPALLPIDSVWRRLSAFCVRRRQMMCLSRSRSNRNDVGSIEKWLRDCENREHVDRPTQPFAWSMCSYRTTRSAFRTQPNCATDSFWSNWQ